MTRKSDDSESGAALALVLVMLAIMATLATVVVDVSRLSTRRTANQTSMEQTRWYLVGAEGYASQQIRRLNREVRDNRIDQSEWQDRPISLPLDDGTMVLSLRDGSNCLNLNGLVFRSDDGALVANPSGQVQFARLLDVLGIRAGGAPDALLVDWIDSDAQPTAGGGEDQVYTQAGLQYRTANTLVGDLSELRAVAGFTDDIVRRLAPFACVRPDSIVLTLNVNTLVASQAELLAVVMGDDISVSTAREVIRSRPQGGWADVDAFLATPRFAGMEITESLRSQLSVTSRYYLLQSHVLRDNGNERAVALIEASGALRTVRRVFGVAASGNVL
jgi:general secretion pathway protein K